MHTTADAPSADSRPALGDGHEALLHQVLGLGEVPDDEVRRSQQRVRRDGDELLEFDPPPVVAAGEWKEIGSHRHQPPAPGERLSANRPARQPGWELFASPRRQMFPGSGERTVRRVRTSAIDAGVDLVDEPLSIGHLVAQLLDRLVTRRVRQRQVQRDQPSARVVESSRRRRHRRRRRRSAASARRRRHRPAPGTAATGRHRTARPRAHQPPAARRTQRTRSAHPTPPASPPAAPSIPSASPDRRRTRSSIADRAASESVPARARIASASAWALRVISAARRSAAATIEAAEVAPPGSPGPGSTARRLRRSSPRRRERTGSHRH